MPWFRFFSIRSKLIGLLLMSRSMVISMTAYVGYRSGREAITESFF